MVWQVLPNGLLAGAFPFQAGGRCSIISRAAPVTTFRRKNGRGTPNTDVPPVSVPQVEAQLADAGTAECALEVNVSVGMSVVAPDGSQSWHGLSRVVPASRPGDDGVDLLENGYAAETRSRQTARMDASLAANDLHTAADAHQPAEFFWSVPLEPPRPGPRGSTPNRGGLLDSHHIHLSFPADSSRPRSSSAALGSAPSHPVDLPPTDRSSAAGGSASQQLADGTVYAADPALLTCEPLVPHAGVLYPSGGPTHRRPAAVAVPQGGGNGNGYKAPCQPQLTRGSFGGVLPEPQHDVPRDGSLGAAACAHPTGSPLGPHQGAVRGRAGAGGLARAEDTRQQPPLPPQPQPPPQQPPQRGRQRPSRPSLSMDGFLRQYDAQLEAQAAAAAKKPNSRRSRAGAASSRKRKSPRDPGGASGADLDAAAPSAAAGHALQLGTTASLAAAVAVSSAQEDEGASSLLRDRESQEAIAIPQPQGFATQAREADEAADSRAIPSASAAAAAAGHDLLGRGFGVGAHAGWPAAQPETASDAPGGPGVDGYAAAVGQVTESPPRASSNGRRPRRMSLYTEFELAQGAALGRMPPGSGMSAWDLPRPAGAAAGSSRLRRSSGNSSGGGGGGGGAAGAGAAAMHAPSRDLEDAWGPEEKAEFWHLVCCGAEGAGGAPETGGAAVASAAATADPASEQLGALLSLSGTPVLICVRQLQPYGAAEVYELPDLGLGAMDESTWEAWGALPGSSRPRQPLMRIDPGVGLGFELCPEAGRGAGGWRSYEVVVGPGYSHDPVRTLHPLRLVCGDRVRYNARHVWDLVEFLADPTLERVAAHLTSAALLRTGRDRAAYHPPAFCHWLLLRRWGAAGLAHVGWGPGDTLRHVRRVRGWNSTLAWEASAVSADLAGAGTGTRPARDSGEDDEAAIGKGAGVGMGVLDVVGALEQVAA